MTAPEPDATPPPDVAPPPDPAAGAAAAAGVAPGPVRPKRHLIRGLLSGLLLGLGLALLVIVYGKAPFGVATPYVIVICGVMAGLVNALVGPTRTTRR